MCEIEINIAYIKKHVYKERKETTHVKVGEENEYISSSYIKMYVIIKMVTRLVYKKLM